MQAQLPKRPDFKTWLSERLEIAAKKKLFAAVREPRTDDERGEMIDEIKSLWHRCGILYYKPTKKQDWFHRSRRAQVRGLFAPNQRGKTTAGEAEILAHGLGFEPWSGNVIERVGKTRWRPGMRFGIGVQDYAGGMQEVILPKMRELLPLEEIGVEFVKQSGRTTHKLIFPWPFNFTIKALSYDQEIHKSEGMTWNGFWFDEPPPRHLYVSVRRGLLRHAAPLWFTGTPLNEPWMYDEIFACQESRAPSFHIESELDLDRIKPNMKAIVRIEHDEYPPGVTKEQIDLWADTLDEDEKRARIYGEFFSLQGRVYKAFSRKRPEDGGQVIPQQEWYDKNPEWKTYPGFCVLDPHDRKPFAFGWGVVTPRDEYVFIDEWPNVDYVKQKQWRWALNEYVDMIRSKEASIWSGDPTTVRGVVWRIIDPNFGRSPKAGTGRCIQDEFNDFGLSFDSSVDDDVEDGHTVVKRDIYEKKIFWLDNCTNFIKSMEQYAYDEWTGAKDRGAKEKPRDKWKDFADLVRYACKYQMKWFDAATVRLWMYPPGFENGGMKRVS